MDGLYGRSEDAAKKRWAERMGRRRALRGVLRWKRGRFANKNR
jgi:hypothetical protein